MTATIQAPSAAYGLHIRHAGERGATRLNWLDSRHSFSFGDYYDPEHEGFRALRVINDDHVQPGGGFDLHPHEDMEIISYVVSGALEHKDTLGNGSVIGAGDIQRMSAGTGIWHSEFNPSKTEPVHFLQIWLLPERRGITPGYQQAHVPEAATWGRPKLIVSHLGRDGSLTINQNASVYALRLGHGERTPLRLAPNRHTWVQVVAGSLTVNGTALGPGDGAAFTNPGRLEFAGLDAAHVLIFDLA
jgi:quercetin 2,3-dioxygenase